VVSRWKRQRSPSLHQFGFILRDTAVLLGLAIVLAAVTYVAYAGQQVSDQMSIAQDNGKVHIDLRNTQKPVADVNFIDIDVNQLRELMAQPLLFVDARGTDDFNKGRVKGAIDLPTFSDSAVRLQLAGISQDTPIVAYCISKTCGRGRAAAGALSRVGYAKIYHFVNGWEELKSLDFVPKETPQPEKATSKPKAENLPF